jgi:hypothetical protein
MNIMSPYSDWFSSGIHFLPYGSLKVFNIILENEFVCILYLATWHLVSTSIIQNESWLH